MEYKGTLPLLMGAFPFDEIVVSSSMNLAVKGERPL